MFMFYDVVGKWVLDTKEVFESGLTTAGIIASGATDSECPGVERGLLSLQLLESMTFASLLLMEFV